MAGNRTCSHRQTLYECPHLSPFQVTVFLIWDAGIVLAIVLGNCLVILSLMKYPKMRTPSNVLLASLAIGDLFVAFVCIPADLLFGLGVVSWISPLQCVTGAACILSVSAVSTWHITAVTFERYLAITKPYKHNSIMTQRNTFKLIVGTWSVAIGISSLSFWDFGNNIHCFRDGCCDLLLALSPMMRALSIVIGSMLPCMVMTGLYMKIIRCALLQLKRITASEVKTCRQTQTTGAFLGQLSKKFHRRDMKAAKTVALVLGAFLLAWTPASLIAMCDVIFPWFIDSHYSTFYLMQLTFFHIAFTNSFVNPIIYCFRNRDFRSSFIKLLQKFLPRTLECHTRLLQEEGVVTVTCVGDGGVALTEVA